MAGAQTRCRAAEPEATRLQTSVLARSEARVLRWLAERLPAGVGPDLLTALALAGTAVTGASYWLARFTPLALVPATLGLAINWFGDSLDGTVARLRHQERPRYGYYVDHVADAIGAVLVLGGLALSGAMRPPIAAALLIAYLLLCIEAYLATYSLRQFQMSFFGVGPTELRILLAAGNVTLWLHPRVTAFGYTGTIFDIGGAVGAAGLAATFVYAVVRHARALAAAERRDRKSVV